MKPLTDLQQYAAEKLRAEFDAAHDTIKCRAIIEQAYDFGLTELADDLSNDYYAQFGNYMTIGRDRDRRIDMNLPVNKIY